jgi:competence protein ComEA
MSGENNSPAPGAGRFFNGWVFAAVLLVAVIIAGGAVIWSRHDRGKSLEISFEPEEIPPGRIYIGGEVNNPGLYPLGPGDTIEDVLQAAGGVTDNADPARLELTVAARDAASSSQKVDINRAEAWLLAALPGIGDTRAQAIVAYRRENGPYRDIYELLKVPGIGSATFENIKELITVKD